MGHDILSVIAAMAEVSGRAPQAKSGRPRQPVITISRDHGSGGDEIARLLAQRMGLDIYDEVLLKEVAARLQDDPAIVRMLDEEFGQAKDMWLYRLLSGKDIGPHTYRETLVKVVLSLGRLGGVIVGRGAHVILAGACALRIRITGTAEICAARLAADGSISEQDALQRVLEVNHRRGHFVWEVFRSRLADATQFDLTINTDRLADFDAIASMLEGVARAIHAGGVLRGDCGG
ncbi:MAG: cytidylate kinase-like family protein [Magnetospirillum sp.]|nr:cytidylate kinase-like family protein [Magnetospirillum sp.]